MQVFLWVIPLRASVDNYGKWTLSIALDGATHQPITDTAPLFPFPHTLWTQLALWHYQRSKAAIYTNIHTYCTCTLPSVASGPFQECQRWFHPLYLPLFCQMTVTHTDWDGCGPESHLKWLNYNKGLRSQRIEHHIKENGGKSLTLTVWFSRMLDFKKKERNGHHMLNWKVSDSTLFQFRLYIALL